MNFVSITISQNKFIDSLHYFQMKLSKLPKIFSLPPCNNKGYTPHLLNTKANKNYKCLQPSSKNYACVTISEVKCREVFTWYNKTLTNNYHFIMEKKIVKYCQIKVTILRQQRQPVHVYIENYFQKL